MYAILDIETTGGQYNEEGITEIAIYKFDGHEITDQFISLINPEIPIQPFVVKLTGISTEMLRTAPKFFEVAKRIIEITSDCVLVAHNALFDYRILKTEFKRLGFDFHSPTLCTVELAQQLIPGQPAYSLGKLVRSLGIPMADRHRAAGDAMATLKLFKLLLSKDSEKVIVKNLIKSGIEKGIEPKLLDIVESLPSTTGIFYVHREDGTIIHISKSRNIRKSVNHHFASDANISKRITAEAYSVTYEETGSELIAAIKERDEINIHRPMFNKFRKRLKPASWTLSSTFAEDGYSNLNVGKTTGRNGLFVSLQEAQNALQRITQDYKLCPKLNGFDQTDGPCSSYSEKCEGACIGLEPVEKYNSRVESVFNRVNFKDRTLAIVDRGRKISERSAILIENGVIKGYAFVDLNYQINNIKVFHNILIPFKSGSEYHSAVRSYLLKNRRVKIVSF